MYAIRGAVVAAMSAALLALPLRSTGAQAVVAGTVVDDATGRPLAGALVRISIGETARATRTDEMGVFGFPNVRLGRISLSVKTLGFAPHIVTLDVVEDLPYQDVRLKRLAFLDTVRVRAARQGLYGSVATAKDLTPLPNANLMIVGVGGGRVRLDSTGHFFVPVKVVGSYFLRAKAPGYAAQSISVVVSPHEGVEVAFLLDSAFGGSNNRLEMAMKDFDERIKRKGLASALVSRTELLERGETGTTLALKYARSFAARSLRLGSTVCLFVDGMPKPFVALDAYHPDEIEAIEAYGPQADRSFSLAQRWPPRGVCGTTGLPSVYPGDDVVKWVAIWLRH